MERMEMEDVKLHVMENDDIDMPNCVLILKDLKEDHPRFKITVTEENGDGKMESCNGEHYPVRLSYAENGQDKRMYFLNKKRMREFNRKYLKRSKNRKDGNYEVNLSKAYPVAMREWLNSHEFQDSFMKKFLLEV